MGYKDAKSLFFLSAPCLAKGEEKCRFCGGDLGKKPLQYRTHFIRCHMQSDDVWSIYPNLPRFLPRDMQPQKLTALETFLNNWEKTPEGKSFYEEYEQAEKARRNQGTVQGSLVPNSSTQSQDRLLQNNQDQAGHAALLPQPTLASSDTGFYDHGFLLQANDPFFCAQDSENQVPVWQQDPAQDIGQADYQADQMPTSPSLISNTGPLTNPNWPGTRNLSYQAQATSPVEYEGEATFPPATREAGESTPGYVAHYDPPSNQNQIPAVRFSTATGIAPESGSKRQRSDRQPIGQQLVSAAKDVEQCRALALWALQRLEVEILRDVLDLPCSRDNGIVNYKYPSYGNATLTQIAVRRERLSRVLDRNDEIREGQPAAKLIDILLSHNPDISLFSGSLGEHGCLTAWTEAQFGAPFAFQRLQKKYPDLRVHLCQEAIHRSGLAPMENKHACCFYGITPILRAAFDGDLLMFEKLVQCAPYNLLDEEPDTRCNVLHLACFLGRYKMAKYILEESKKLEKVKDLLMTKRTKPCLWNTYNACTPFLCACSGHREKNYARTTEYKELVQLLLEEGADHKDLDADGCGALLLAGMRGNRHAQEGLFEYYKDNLEPVHEQDTHNLAATPLQHAVLGNDCEAIQPLLDLGIDPMAPDIFGKLPQDYLDKVEPEKRDAVRTQLKNAADVKAKTLEAEEMFALMARVSLKSMHR